MKAYSEVQMQQFYMILVRGVLGVTPHSFEVQAYPAAACIAVRAKVGRDAPTIVDFWVENMHSLAFAPDCIVKQDKFETWPPTPNVKILLPDIGELSA